MNVTFGMKAHSGWAALVVLGERDGEPEVVDRRRVELVEHEWEKQPYHAAEDLEQDAAREVVRKGIRSAYRTAAREMRAALKREQKRKNEVTACAVLVADAMPDWTLEDILSVHFRMHKAEGLLFRDALVQAAAESQLQIIKIPEKSLAEYAETALKIPGNALVEKISLLGKSVGPPWGKDQKDAALAALVALRKRSK